MGTKENTTGTREQRTASAGPNKGPGAAPGKGSSGGPGAKTAPPSTGAGAAASTAARSAAPPPAEVDPDELVRKAEGQHGVQAAETLLAAALAFRRRPDVVAAVHCLERGLGELQEQIETPPAARMGAELEYQLGILCEEELGRFEDALVHYQTAFKLRPDNLEPLRRGRGIYQSLGDMDMVARLIELHLANLVANETQSGVALALELGQLKLRLNDPAGAVEALRGALRMHNDGGSGEEVPEPLLSTLADAYVSPDYQPGMAEKDQARARSISASPSAT
jgi:tetratricopeptide (TPR) repeat protein